MKKLLCCFFLFFGPASAFADEERRSLSLRSTFQECLDGPPQKPFRWGPLQKNTGHELRRVPVQLPESMGIRLFDLMKGRDPESIEDVMGMLSIISLNLD